MFQKIFFQLILLLCFVCFFSCNKEVEKPQANISHFTLNETDSILPNTAVYIQAGCREYNLSAKPYPNDATMLISINGAAFSSLGNSIVLHDSIYKISAYATHLDFEKSAVVSLDIAYKSNNFSGATALYPNPASDYTNLRIKNNYRGPITLSILDVWGNSQSKTEVEKTKDLLEVRIDLGNFKAGLYVYKLSYSDCAVTGKFIVER